MTIDKDIRPIHRRNGGQMDKKRHVVGFLREPIGLILGSMENRIWKQVEQKLP